MTERWVYRKVRSWRLGRHYWPRIWRDYHDGAAVSRYNEEPQ